MLGIERENIEPRICGAISADMPFLEQEYIQLVFRNTILDSSEPRVRKQLHDHGDLGAASVPVSLARALADGYGLVLAVSHGSGAGADALLLELTGDLPANVALEGDDQLSYAEYLRQRGVVTTGPLSGGGAYVSVPTWRRSTSQCYHLTAGRCPDCGSLKFPPEGACNDCGSLDSPEPVELSGMGTIEAVTTISQDGAPPEFAEQQA